MAGIAALAIGYVLSQFYRSFLAVLTPVLTSELGMTKVDLSVASGAWFATFALAQFAVGVWLDRFGPRRTASIMLAVFAGCGALAVLGRDGALDGDRGDGADRARLRAGPDVASSSSTRATIRRRASRCWRPGRSPSARPATSSAPRRWPPPRRRSAGGRRWWRSASSPWRRPRRSALFVRDPAKPEGVAAGSSGLSGYGELFKMRVLWPIMPLTALNYAPATGIRGLWSGPYLADVYGADSLVIGEVTMFMALAMVGGAFLYGPLDTIFRTRKWVAVAGNTVTVLTLAYLALHPMPGIAATTLLLVVIGLAGGSYGLLMAHARAFVPAHLTGRGVTLMNFFSIGGVGAMQFATGGVVTAWSVPGEPASGYVALFTFYALMVGLALLIYLFSRDAKPEAAKR